MIANTARKMFAAAAWALLALAAALLPAGPAWADAAVGMVGVEASDPCTVELVGVSGNASGYSESADVSGKAVFEVALDEPGTYEYEMRQVASGGKAVYDETVYQVWVTAYYEGEKMMAAVTGGIKGTEDKPDAFRFSKPDETDGNGNGNGNVSNSNSNLNLNMSRPGGTVPGMGDLPLLGLVGVIVAAGLASAASAVAKRISRKRNGR